MKPVSNLGEHISRCYQITGSEKEQNPPGTWRDLFSDLFNLDFTLVLDGYIVNHANQNAF